MGIEAGDQGTTARQAALEWSKELSPGRMNRSRVVGSACGPGAAGIEGRVALNCRANLEFLSMTRNPKGPKTPLRCWEGTFLNLCQKLAELRSPPTSPTRRAG